MNNDSVEKLGMCQRAVETLLETLENSSDHDKVNALCKIINSQYKINTLLLRKITSMDELLSALGFNYTQLTVKTNSTVNWVKNICEELDVEIEEEMHFRQ